MGKKFLWHTFSFRNDHISSSSSSSIGQSVVEEMRVPNDRRHILFRLAMLLLRILSGRPSRGCELLTSRVANFQRCSLVDGQVQFNAFYIGPLRRDGGRSLKPIDVALHNLLSVVSDSTETGEHRKEGQPLEALINW